MRSKSQGTSRSLVRGELASVSSNAGLGMPAFPWLNSFHNIPSGIINFRTSLIINKPRAIVGKLLILSGYFRYLRKPAEEAARSNLEPCQRQ